MYKIKLSNGTFLDIENGSDQNCLSVVADNLTFIDAYVKGFTKENLNGAEIINENDEVVLTLKDKYFTGFDGTPIVGEEEKFIVCFRLADIYSVEDKLAMLEAENARLNDTVNTLLGVEEQGV